MCMAALRGLAAPEPMECKQANLPDNEGEGFYPSSFKLSTKTECQNKCKRDTRCNAFTWLETKPSSMSSLNCWLTQL